MAITFVGSYGWARLTGAQPTGILGTSLTLGNLAIITVEWYGIMTDIITVTDSNGNVWHKVPGTFQQNSYGGGAFQQFGQQVWYSNVTAGGATNITADFHGSVDYPAMYGCEVANANTVDQSNSAKGNGVPNSGNITTGVANTFIYGSVYDDGGGSTAAGSGWTDIQHHFNQYENEYRIESSTGTFSASTNQAGTVQYTAAIVSFKYVAPPSGVTTPVVCFIQ